MSGRFIGIGIALFVLVSAALNAFFIVDQTQQALVLQFGKPVNIITKAGMHFKTPFLDSVVYFDKRMITMNAEPKSVILRDQDRLVVDAYVTYKITDPLLFYQAVRSDIIMRQRLEKMLETSLREVLGREDLNSLLSPKREQIMKNIRENVARLASGRSLVVAGKKIDTPKDMVAPITTPESEAMQQGNIAASDAVNSGSNSVDAGRAGFGVQVMDVRIMRTDLPKETSAPIYSRMQSDRQKVAERFRAEGQKESQIITSEADRERTVIMAQAERKASTIRGEGDALASKIFAESFGQDPEFFEFYRSLQAYKNSLKKENTTLILSPESDFLKYMKKRD
jgi:membrane protease subunit HflC